MSGDLIPEDVRTLEIEVSNSKFEFSVPRNDGAETRLGTDGLSVSRVAESVQVQKSISGRVGHQSVLVDFGPKKPKPKITDQCIRWPISDQLYGWFCRLRVERVGRLGGLDGWAGGFIRIWASFGPDWIFSPSSDFSIKKIDSCEEE